MAILLVVLYYVCRNLPNICPWVNFITKRGEPSRNTLISLIEELLQVKHAAPSVYWCVRYAGVVLFRGPPQLGRGRGGGLVPRLLPSSLIAHSVIEEL